MVGDELISAKVSFKPPFYSCLTCSPQELSGTFNKRSGNWYDDDYISETGKSQSQQSNNQDEDENDNDQEAAYDDQYRAANDDVNNAGDDYYGGRQLTASYLTASTDSGKDDDANTSGDDYYDDFYEGRQLTAPYLTASTESGHYLTASKDDLQVSQIYRLLNSSISGPVCLTILLFIICRPITMSFGRHFRKWKHNETFTAATTTTMLASGTCARESTSTAFGATRSAVRLISSDLTNGQHRTSLSCPL
jgi:hypothetical protein